jgi:hypothetical protein
MDTRLRGGIVETARSLGMDPIVLATIMSYETGGTFNPTQRGPTTQWGQHRGLIQFGEPQARQYGVDWNDPIGSQLGPNGAVAKYYRANGWKPGMSELDAYSIVNAGGPGRYNASDANNGGAPGTVADKVSGQFGPHRSKAAAFLGDVNLSFGPSVPAAPTTMAGIAGMFGGGGLSMGAPADPFAAAAQAQAAQQRDRRKDEEEAAQVKRQALLSGIGSMFG